MDEDVIAVVGVAGHQVASGRLKHHIAPIGGDEGPEGIAVSLRTVGGNGDARGLACFTVVDEDIPITVGVTAHKVAGQRIKCHVAPVSGDGRVGAGLTISLRAVGCDGNARGLPRLTVVDKDVRGAVSVSAHKVAGPRHKRHVAPVSGDGREIVGQVLPLRAVGCDGDTRGLARLTVVDKDVPGAVGVAAHKVAGRRRKCHVASVGRDRGEFGIVIPLRAVRGNRDARGLPRLAVVDEDILTVVGIGAHQVV